MTDAAALRERLVSGARIVAVGAGFIGLEVAAAARGLGCEVTVVEKAAHAMSRVIDPVVGGRLIALHIEQGVRFVWGQGVDQVAAKAGGARVRLEDGSELEADVVVAGVGASPNTTLAEAAGLPCDNGILVDEFGRTADPAIFAAGDVTCHYNPFLGRWLRLESWQNAQNQGIAVGRVLAGQGEPYAEIPWFWSDQYGANFQMIGAPMAWDRVIVREGPQPSKFTAVYLQENRVVAGNTLNNARDIRSLRQLIQMERPVDAALLADPAQALSAIVKLQEAI
jgi:3-phenylpropionate/trans-cinnamate dioxygenase ferredoxin reductase subunit